MVSLSTTEEKQVALTQDEDSFSETVLQLDGEEGHGNDQRVSDNRDRFFLVDRKRHHMPFT